MFLRKCPTISRIAAALIMMIPTQATASEPSREMLRNGSFEQPSVGAGDNFLTTLPEWTVQADHPPGTDDGRSINVVRPHEHYSTGASTTPTGGEFQYLDIVNSRGTARQRVVIPSSGTVDLEAWFSQRDRPHRLDGSAIRLLREDGSLVAEAYASFDGSDPLGIWKNVRSSGIRVPAGPLVVEIDLPDTASVDLASLSFSADAPGRLTLSKSVRTLADPINRISQPKAIPGATMAYTLDVENVGDTEIDADTQVLQDATPPNLAFWSTDRFPIVFSAADSGLTLRYGGVSDTTDDVEFSADGGSTWTHAPTGARDTSITNVRLRPKGAMKPHSRYRIEIPYVVL